MSDESDALELAIDWHAPISPSSHRSKPEDVVATATALKDYIDSDDVKKQAVQLGILNQRPNDPNAVLPDLDDLLAAAEAFGEFITPPEP